MIRMRNLKLKHRIFLPNALYLVILGAVLLFFFNSNSLIKNIQKEQNETNNISENIRQVALDIKGYISGDIPFDELEDGYKKVLSEIKFQQLTTAFDQLWKDVTEIRDFRQINSGIESQVMDLTTSSIKISDEFIKQVSQKLADESLRSDVTNLERLTIIGANINTSSNYRVQVLFGHLKKSLKAKDRMLTYLDTSLTNVEKDIKQLKGTPFEQMPVESRNLILKIRELTLEYISNMEAISSHQQTIFAEITDNLEKINTITRNSNDAFFSKIRNYFGIILAVILLIAVLGGTINFFFSRSLSGILSRIGDGLAEGADQVASASEQVSSSSQLLAEGSSEQAASLEETASSLEEMTAMTEKNSENANEADRLMKSVQEVVNTANNSMHELTASMTEISNASEETQKIVKTIDEIAFQTNLLALNAAVEAARAGEAGAGFAVVADEVRNLAMRAAEAAKNTAELIEGTVKKIGGGSEIVDKTNDAFSKVQESSDKVGELVAEIAAASMEQSNGISQVNKAVNEMDKVVQQNAANAEENASASEEMNAQAFTMKEYVGELVALVGESTKKRSDGRERAVEQRNIPVAHNSLIDPEKEASGKKIENHNIKQSKVVKPDQVIPMDDDFDDF